MIDFIKSIWYKKMCWIPLLVKITNFVILEIGKVDNKPYQRVITETENFYWIIEEEQQSILMRLEIQWKVHWEYLPLTVSNWNDKSVLYVPVNWKKEWDVIWFNQI